METAYGNSLTEFFNDWIYNQGYPTYTITAQNWGTGQVKVTVNQTQSHASVSYFEMPLPLRFTNATGQTYDTTIENTSNNQQFIISVPFAITGVLFDPDKNIISKNNVVTLSSDSFEVDKAIEIYPNPVNSECHIQTPSDIVVEKIILFNDLGQLVEENNTLNFSFSTLSSGIYHAQIQTSKGTYHKKIIKK
jgi:hypothetical protein